MRRKIKIIQLFLASVLTLNAQNNTSSSNWKLIFDKYNSNGTMVLYNISSDNTKTYNTKQN